MWTSIEKVIENVLLGLQYKAVYRGIYLNMVALQSRCWVFYLCVSCSCVLLLKWQTKGLILYCYGKRFNDNELTLQLSESSAHRQNYFNLLKHTVFILNNLALISELKWKCLKENTIDNVGCYPFFYLWRAFLYSMLISKGNCEVVLIYRFRKKLKFFKILFSWSFIV